jgi:hypothetical protein
MPFQGSQPPAQVQKKPPSSQESKGDNSPNIIAGDHSTITITGTGKNRNPRFREKVNTITLSVGGVHALVRASMLATPYSGFMVFGNQKPFTFYMDQGTIYVDIKIPNGTLPNSPAIEITRNEFSQAPPGWDRNFDDSALEFVNRAGAPVFQLLYGESEVKLMGVFLIGGSLVVANETGLSLGAAPGPANPLPAKIFKYPSISYPHVRVAQ